MHDDDSPHVRPFGYVAPDPVVRRVADDLFLGNWRAADPAQCDRRFDHVLSVSTEAQPATTHHRPLVDGDEAAWPAFARAVDAARDLLAREGSLLVHCNAGVSRSAAVLATALAADGAADLHESLARVQRARPAAMPHPRLHELGVVYLAAEG